MKLLIEVAGDRLCHACPWYDRAAAGACTLWSKAMTSGERIPECLAAERAWDEERAVAHESGRKAGIDLAARTLDVALYCDLAQAIRKLKGMR